MKILIIASFLIGCFAYAQEPARTNPIENQFSTLIKKSNNFQEYKVVKKLDLDKLKTNTDTYILQLDNKIADLEKEIAAENEAQSALEKELSASKSQVDHLDEQKDSIAIMGVFAGQIHLQYYSMVYCGGLELDLNHVIPAIQKKQCYNTSSKNGTSYRRG